jgi:hypothetical protein
MATREQKRYAVVFTPIGWQIVDTEQARDPVAEFGTGDLEYRRATKEALRLNEISVENRNLSQAW